MPTAPTIIDPYAPLVKQALPAGRPRSWYVMHNRRLKAMRLAIALLDSGVYRANLADNQTIRHTAEVVGIRPPSNKTCSLVRDLMRVRRV
ncbi:hypothetical protein A5780_17090 [Nocardia sp. 852002-20019_SCH5090214]|jgi:hypothetical protein|uniref:Uncharacterized protein n=1 Tax=Nocardia nova TaxID=37330 RepID=A0A2S6A0D0_9NOCA|nr:MULTISPECIES: hypothetical protein [Nocardia]OBF66104.1 hypothetical protein A9X06_07260 [Mycobacterium sp. 852002-51759_SCH5129042]MBF6149726.1 hypothetical protein [Nocardia nova]MBF6274876.1 hypothetical protein [Nocardia nova]MBV7707783.1 hypothetical protein [Nocardia nova]MDN2499930.1 hypothetical protein [Nocardia nova]